MNKKILFSLILLITFVFSFKVFALETTWPTSPFGTNLTDYSTLTDMVRYFYEWGIFIGGLAVFIALLIGGFLYLTSMGNPARISEAKDRIFSALIGLVLLFSIYLILNTINPELTILTQLSVSPACDTAPNDCPGPTCDCPTGFECRGDTAPGDGIANGICYIKVTTANCDVDGDCPEPSPDLDVEKNIVCRNDPAPGDGNPEGKCVSRCIEVIFYGNIDYSNERFRRGLLTCEDIQTSVGGGSPVVIQSIDIRGSCVATLYRDTADCTTGSLAPVSAGVDVKNIKEMYGVDPAEFQSVKVEEFSPF